MSFVDWITSVIYSVPLGVLTLLTLSVIFVNGWTDAPNAIASCVATRALSVKGAVIMAAVFNFFGLILSVAINRRVTDTVFSMVDFGTDPKISVLALCAALFAIVLWAVTAWWFGIPTSESHALIAGVTGAALALSGSSGVRFSVWSRVVFGLVLSVLIGFFFGYFLSLLLSRLAQKERRAVAQRRFGKGQILGSAINAFLHGAQDGQKFIGVLLLSVAAFRGTAVETIPFWMVLLCSVVLSLGTAFGGGRIIRTVGVKMVKPERYQGVASDGATAVSLALCTLFGLPVSTTHVKTSAVMGAGATRSLRSVNWGIVGQMLLAWVFTFPGCGLLGYCMAKLFFFFL